MDLWEPLEMEIAYQFADSSLLKQALTHPSFVHENPETSVSDYQRLEFLGDAVLNLCVSTILFKRLPASREGELSRLKSFLVSAKFLAEVACHYRLDKFLLLGKGEESSGGREKISILASSLEALLGAIYLDGGIDKVIAFMENTFHFFFPHGLEKLIPLDHRAELEKVVVRRFKVKPRYYLLGKTGAAHAPTFEVGVSIADILRLKGKGRSKKEAIHEAARKALEFLEENE